MELPVIRGVIDRRILVNYRVDPDLLARMLPAPFRPKRVHGFAVAGICLIRLKEVRPAFLPAWLGLSSENAAHRVAVEWEESGAVREGVYIPRRDTNTRLNSLIGGRLFPGVHHHARFTVNESADRFEIGIHSDDAITQVLVRARRAEGWPPSALFRSPAEASMFFQAGSRGYSATSDLGRFEGLELDCSMNNLEPLAIEEVCSSSFNDTAQFPAGSIACDSAFLMRGVVHRWRGKPDLCCDRDRLEGRSRRRRELNPTS